MSELASKCAVCGSLLDEEDLFCANCGTEAPKRESAAKPPDNSSRISTDNFECSGCGASMSYDASAKALRCPFCGSVKMEHQPDARVLAPNRVVPFRLKREESVDVMRKWLRKGIWRPTGLERDAAVVQMVPVYVPYWVFQANTHSYWTADTSQTPPGARGDWYPLAGEHRGSYDALLVGASGALTPRETWDICPFELNEGVPPGQVDLDNVIVEQFSVPRKYARPLAQEGIQRSEAEACRSAYVPGNARNVHVNVRVTEMASEPVLLPVWIMAYRFQDRVFRFLVNGQTGRATGEAPISYLKIAAAIGILLLIFLFVLLMAGVFGHLFGMTPIVFPLAAILPHWVAGDRPSTLGRVSGILERILNVRSLPRFRTDKEDVSRAYP